MFAEVAGSNGKEGAKEGGDNNASVRPSVHPTFVCEAENESQLKRELGGRRRRRTRKRERERERGSGTEFKEFYDFSGDCGGGDGGGGERDTLLSLGNFPMHFLRE